MSNRAIARCSPGLEPRRNRETIAELLDAAADAR
jgi:hypothetical protein